MSVFESVRSAFGVRVEYPDDDPDEDVDYVCALDTPGDVVLHVPPYELDHFEEMGWVSTGEWIATESDDDVVRLVEVR